MVEIDVDGAWESLVDSVTSGQLEVGRLGFCELDSDDRAELVTMVEVGVGEIAAEVVSVGPTGVNGEVGVWLSAV